MKDAEAVDGVIVIKVTQQTADVEFNNENEEKVGESGRNKAKLVIILSYLTI